MPSFRAFATRWTLIRHAGAHTPDGREALETLLGEYRQSIYRYFLECGFQNDRAEDLVQEFYFDAVTRRPLSAADPGQGRFRTYLAVRLQRFVTDERRRMASVRHGGGFTHLSRDDETLSANERTRLEGATTEDPDRLFGRELAKEVLRRSEDAIREEFCSVWPSGMFEDLHRMVTQEGEVEAYQSLSMKYSLDVSNLKSKTYRLRKRYRQVIRELVRELIDEEDDLNDELAHLQTLL